MMRKFKKILYIIALVAFYFNLSVVPVGAASDLILEKIIDCGMVYMGDSCVVEMKVTNNTKKVLEGKFDFSVQYKEELFDGEGILAKFLPDIATNNWLSSSAWVEGIVVFTGFNIAVGETFILLEIDTHPALCPGEYSFVFSLTGIADNGEEYIALPVYGGGGGSSPGLSILDESIRTTEVGENSVTITWTTSYFSTSQVVYGTDFGVFSLTQPNYGYPNAAPDPEDSTKVVAHSVTITGLIPNTTYYYRTVSHASPATISLERRFTTLVAGEEIKEESGEEISAGADGDGFVVDMAVANLSDGVIIDELEGTSEEEASEGELDEKKDENGEEETNKKESTQSESSNNGLLAGIAGLGSSLGGWLIIIAIILLLAAILITIRKNKQKN